MKAISEDVQAVVAPQDWVALILGGGYGRGEGGALRTAYGFRPYNDYDLVLIHRSRDPAQWTDRLRELEHNHGRLCGIHVDVKPLTEASIPELPHTLTWYELQRGHRVLAGKANVLEKMGRHDLSQILPSEWGRLLFNRGSGLLFSIWLHQGKRCSFAADESPEVFMTRQIQKGWLALGDVWLAERGLYNASVVQRAAAWREQENSTPDYRAEYLRAVEFKLSPVEALPRSELIEELSKLTPRFVEQLKRHPASERRPLVGTYATLKMVRPRRWLFSRPWRYPRERLRLALIDELQGRSLARRRLVGSPEDYIRLWEAYA